MRTEEQVWNAGDEQLRQELDRARAQITYSVSALREDVREGMDWRQWVRRYPAPALGVAFALGYWLGSRT